MATPIVDGLKRDGNGEVEELSQGVDDQDEVPGTVGNGTLVKIKDGIAVDSGSLTFVMPTKWLPGLPTEPPPGSKRGQTFVGATGRTLANTGQWHVNVFVDDGMGRKFNKQCGDVSKMLGSVGCMADVLNCVRFRRSGGWIVPGKHTIQFLLEDQSPITTFDRHGMVYRMDARVRKADGQKDVKMNDANGMNKNMDFKCVPTLEFEYRPFAVDSKPKP